MADLMDEQYEEQGMEMAGSDEDSEGEELDESQKHAYLPGKPMSTEETLVMDESAYIMYHQANTGAPCLSFDIMRDDLGERRETFPLSCYLVAGTQEELNLPSQLIIMKMTDLTKMETSDDSESSDSDSESDDDEDKKPGLVTAIVRHNGCVNRVKIGYVKDAKFAATWSETGVVYIWDMKRPLEAVDDLSQMPVFRREAVSAYKPVFSFAGHLVEGFAMDWSPTVPGRMATGDCRKNIHLWTPTEGGSWSVDQRPYSAHTSSVEDIQWSPVEDNVFASCSVDRTIRIWDARAAPNKACMLTAMNTHQKDVNVISWNRHEPFLLSGGDDGMIKVWDLRKFKGGKSVAVFKHHNGPITSLEWNPNDSSVFAASGQDHQVTLWDLAVERDNEDPEADDLAEPDIPPQLLFIHQGQQEVKEIHWHPQLPGVVLSTAADGFNVFRTISV